MRHMHQILKYVAEFITRGEYTVDSRWRTMYIYMSWAFAIHIGFDLQWKLYTMRFPLKHTHARKNTIE